MRYRTTHSPLPHPRTIVELTEDEHNTLLDRIQLQASSAAGGVLPRPFTLQAKIWRDRCSALRPRFTNRRHQVQGIGKDTSRTSTRRRTNRNPAKSVAGVVESGRVRTFSVLTRTNQTLVSPPRVRSRPISTDFSPLTPCGRRFQRRLCDRSWLLREDGFYLPVVVPGPATWDGWGGVLARVRSCLAHAPCGQTTTQTRVSPHRPLSRPTSSTSRPCMVKGFSEAWHLCDGAEDRCRTEHCRRLARQLTAKKGQLPPQWSEVFVAASEDERY